MKELRVQRRDRRAQQPASSTAQSDGTTMEANAHTERQPSVRFSDEQQTVTSVQWLDRRLKQQRFLVDPVPVINLPAKADAFSQLSNKQTVLAGNPTLLAKDDFLLAFTSLCDLHIDYAHTISIRHRNEQYYLMIVVDGVDFLWANPTKTKLLPEELLDEFLRYTLIKVSKL
eukprot:2356416-Rhodomonas_salina.1